MFAYIVGALGVLVEVWGNSCHRTGKR